MDLALDLNPRSPTYKDIYLGADGDLATVKDAAGIKQDILTSIRQILGEWFLDTSDGVPYFQTIFIKNPNQAFINAAFIQRISNVPGVLNLLSFSISRVDATRSLTINFKAQTLNGTVDYSGLVTG